MIRIKAAPGGNGTGPKAALAEKAQADTPAAGNGAEAHPEAMASS